MGARRRRRCIRHACAHGARGRRAAGARSARSRCSPSRCRAAARARRRSALGAARRWQALLRADRRAPASARRGAALPHRRLSQPRRRASTRTARPDARSRSASTTGRTPTRRRSCEMLASNHAPGDVLHDRPSRSPRVPRQRCCASCAKATCSATTLHAPRPDALARRARQLESTIVGDSRAERLHAVRVPPAVWRRQRRGRAHRALARARDGHVERRSQRLHAAGHRAIEQRVLAQVRPGSIIISHDGGGPRGQTLAAYPKIIPALRRRGYGIVTIPQLLGFRPVYEPCVKPLRRDRRAAARACRATRSSRTRRRRRRGTGRALLERAARSSRGRCRAARR